MPGMRPWLAISRKQRRESLNLRRNPRERPVNWQRLRRRIGEEFLGILLRASTAARRSSIVRSMSRITPLRAVLFSHLFFTIRSRFFCLATCDFFAMVPLLFSTSRPFLALLAVGIFFIDDVNAPLAADNLVPLRWVGLYRSSDFHEIPLIQSSWLYPLPRFTFKVEDYTRMQYPRG